MEKDRGNFCEYFEMTAPNNFSRRGEGEGATERLRKLLGD
tara:strand:+ start:340 stop:459 length:120 start_codon:yes stop_codon:yes gene_type:complete